MARLFKYKIDKRYLPFLVPFGLRPSKHGVTLTETSFVAKVRILESQDATFQHRRRGCDPRLLLVDGRRPKTFQRRRRSHLRHDEDAGVCVHFHEKVPVAAEAKAGTPRSPSRSRISTA